MVVQMAEHRHDMKQYVIKARETFKLQEELLLKDIGHDAGEATIPGIPKILSR